MSIILFILILGALIFVHELGHFLLAKKNGIRVDEFAIGFPPTIYSKTVGETKYSLNSIPFGGFVRIFGENPDDESLDPNAENSFVNKSRWVQASVLVAGVIFNVIFAWFLFWIIFAAGMPTEVTEENMAEVRNPEVYIMEVSSESPAEIAGLISGDKILSISHNENQYSESLNIETIRETISTAESEVILQISRAGETLDVSVQPESGIIEENMAIGIAMSMVGQKHTPIHEAFVESFTFTIQSTGEIFRGLGAFFGGLFTGDTNLENVSGPVGIVGLVGDAARFGWMNILTFTAVLSINLAVLNIMPFPALDGGRLLFLGIEGISRKRIPTSFTNAVNAVGFMILIGLMVIITVSDVFKLF